MTESRKPIGPNKRTLLALEYLAEKGIDPIDILMEALQYAQKARKKNEDAYDKFRGLTDKGDAGSAYLSNANTANNQIIQIGTQLAKHVYPTLSAVAFKDMTDNKPNQIPIDAKAVRETILNDPMAKKIAKLAQGIEEPHILTKDILPTGKDSK